MWPCSRGERRRLVLELDGFFFFREAVASLFYGLVCVRVCARVWVRLFAGVMSLAAVSTEKNI